MLLAISVVFHHMAIHMGAAFNEENLFSHEAIYIGLGGLAVGMMIVAYAKVGNTGRRAMRGLLFFICLAALIGSGTPSAEARTETFVAIDNAGDPSLARTDPTWAAVHSAENAETVSSPYLRAGVTISGNDNGVLRSFVFFDTSILGTKAANVTINSAIISLFGQTDLYLTPDNFFLVLQDAENANDFVTLSDFYFDNYHDNFGQIHTTDWEFDAYNYITLNSTARDRIDTTGITGMILRTDNDIDNKPPSAGENLLIAAQGRFVEATDPVLTLEVNYSPVADIGYPLNGFAVLLNDSINFTSDSRDADEEDDLAPNHTWDFGDGTTSILKEPIHTYTQAGTYTITLQVTDGEYTDSDTHTLTVVGEGGAPLGGLGSGGGGGVSLNVLTVAVLDDALNPVTGAEADLLIDGVQIDTTRSDRFGFATLFYPIDGDYEVVIRQEGFPRHTEIANLPEGRSALTVSLSPFGGLSEGDVQTGFAAIAGILVTIGLVFVVRVLTNRESSVRI